MRPAPPSSEPSSQSFPYATQSSRSLSPLYFGVAGFGGLPRLFGDAGARPVAAASAEAAEGRAPTRSPVQVHTSVQALGLGLVLVLAFVLVLYFVLDDPWMTRG